jgi:TM2 domain-containing membrane protein YozV
MNSHIRFFIALLGLCFQIEVKAQYKQKINPSFLSHLRQVNLEQERLTYYKIVDFSNASDTFLTKDISRLCVKYNDSLLIKSYSHFAKDTNDLIDVFYASLILNLNQTTMQINQTLTEQKLSIKKLSALAELINFSQGKVDDSVVSVQFNTTVQRINLLNKKSIFLATVFSMLIPGAGKYYLLQNGEASSALVLNLLASAPFAESIVKFGLLSTVSLFSGIVLLPVYFANVYGTYKSKKSLLNKLNFQLRNEVLEYCDYQLHH